MQSNIKPLFLVSLAVAIASLNPFANAAVSLKLAQLVSQLNRKACVLLSTSIVSFSTLSPIPAFATDASKLFAEAENAIQLTQKEYRDVESEWSSARRKIIESSSNLGKNSELIKGVKTILIDLDSKVQKFGADANVVVSSLDADIESLKASTAAKYDTAKQFEDAVSGEKIDTISKSRKLYKDAENEAILLTKAIDTLKSYKEVLGTNVIILPEKSKSIVNDIQAILSRADDVQIQQGNGLALLTQGLTKNINACHYGGPQCVAKDQNGIAVFKQGVVQIDAAQDNSAKISKDLDKNFKDIQFVETQLAGVSIKLNTLTTEINEWEKDKNLKLKAAKNALKASVESAEKAFAASKLSVQKFASVDEKLLGKTDKKSVETDQLVKLELKKVYTELVQADKEGRLTERLLREAKAQGDKEAASYMQYIPKVTAASGTKK